ncbi:MAG: hypothetical protein WC955_07185 [Elusimicrobiota bacterium]
MSEKPFKRKKILVNKELQWKYTMMVAAALLVMLVMSVIAAFFMVQTILPDIFSSAYKDTVKSIYLWLVVIGLIFVGLVIWLSLYFSHRIAGPLYRIEKDINDIIETSDFSKRIVLRQKDELSSLAGTINTLIAAIQINYRKNEVKK